MARKVNCAGGKKKKILESLENTIPMCGGKAWTKTFFSTNNSKFKRGYFHSVFSLRKQQF